MCVENEAYIKKLNRSRIQQNRMFGILCMLSILVSVAVFWQLRTIGITISDEACCGKTAHTHTDTCVVEQKLICEKNEKAETLIKELGCQIEEHNHVETCFKENTNLACELFKDESTHLHEEGCYQTEVVTMCSLEEHTHEDVCWAEDTSEMEGHIHSDACYSSEYSCGFEEEHTHEIMCYSDPGADVEIQSEWEATIPNELTGVWPEDVIAVAKSQLGYMESENNFILADDGETRQGYTRYGEWAGNPYGNWDAMFAAFCIHYAGIPEDVFPVATGGNAWKVKLNEQELYAEKENYLPKEGDLVFFEDEKVGILIAIRDEKIYTAEGDSEDAVSQCMYDISDQSIIGFGCLNKLYEREKNINTEAVAEEEIIEESSIMPFALSANAGARVSVVDAPDYIGTINEANEWQIVSNQYTGRSQSNKSAVDSDRDGIVDVYLQKNVVPTAIENEFLVYLSMDKKMTWESFLDSCSFGLSTTGKYNEKHIGTITNKMEGNKTTQISEHNGSGTNKYNITFKVYEKKGDTRPLYTYTDERWGTTPNASMGTLFMNAPGVTGYIIVQVEVSLKTDGNGSGSAMEAEIYLDAFVSDFATYDTSFREVRDEMGENIEFIEVVASDGSASFQEASNTLVWKPIDNPDVISAVQTGASLSGWENNVVQLVYKVRLNTAQSGFDSCADNMNSKSGDSDTYDVNKSAVLSYQKEPLSGASGTASRVFEAQFPVPEVRGLLYNITFVKKGDDGKTLSNAVFGLYEADGITPVFRNGEAYTLKTIRGEISKFEDLETGTYVVKEITPPPHYAPPSQSAWTVVLCYTTDSRKLKQDSSDTNNMRWTGNDSTDGQWYIINTKEPFEFEIEMIKKDHNSEILLEGAVFELEPSKNTVQKTTDENGYLMFEGKYSPNIEYTITEVTPPDGYYALPFSIKFKIQENEETGEYEVVFLNESDFADEVNMSLDESANDPVLSITVKNTTGFTLPETGGSGTNLYTYSGLLLIAITLMYGYILRRKQERRLEK